MIKKIRISLFAILSSLVILTPIITTFSCSSDKDIKRINYKYEHLKHNFIDIIKNDCSTTKISSNVINILNKKLSSLMPYGPEVFTLDKILIENENNINEAEFNYDSMQISFNAKKLNSLNLKYDEDKAEYIYELIYHEYMHLISYNYFLNSVNNINNEIYFTYNGQRKIEPFTQEFINNFKHALKYDINTSKYQQGKIYKNYISLGSIYNQKELFENANNQNLKNLDNLIGNEIMAPKNPDKAIFKMGINPIIKEKSLQYLFSIDELIARKYELSTFKYRPTISSNTNEGEGFNLKGWINYGKNKQFWSPYLQDVLNVQRGINNNETYLFDNPLLNKEPLKELLTKQFDTKNNISLIWLNKENKINIGGYLPNNKYNYLAFKNKDDSFEYFKLKKESNYYSLKDFIISNNIIDKPIYFAVNKNKNEITKLTNIYNSFQNQITTKHINEQNNTINYKVIKEQNNIKIQQIT